MDPPNLQRIAAQLKSGYVLFIGAGLSMGAGLEGWDAIIGKLKSAFECPYDHDFLTVAQAYEHTYGRPSLLSAIRRYTDATGKKPTPVHQLLPQLDSQVWFTTNYDDLLERTIDKAGKRKHVIFKDAHLAYGGWNEVTLVKLHGDATDPDTIIITKKDYHHCLQRCKLVWNFLRNELAQKCCLFLGYSIRDPDFDQVQAEVFSLMGDHFKKSWAVMFGIDEIARADLEARNIEVIDLGNKKGDEATIALADFLGAIANEVKRLPSIPREYLEIEEAKELDLVSADQLAEFESTGYQFICCIAYQTYCATFDQREFTPTMSGWKPELPREYKTDDHLAHWFEKWNVNMTECWQGWRVARKQTPHGSK